MFLKVVSNGLDDLGSLDEVLFFRMKGFGGDWPAFVRQMSHFLLLDSILHAVQDAHTLLS